MWNNSLYKNKHLGVGKGAAAQAFVSSCSNVVGSGVAGQGLQPFPMVSSHHPQQLATTALYFTYSALEEEMDRNKDHPAFAPLYFPLELHRKEALTKDMEYFFGEDWEEQVQCSEAARKYVERIDHHIQSFLTLFTMT